jgi:hypothetical protein
VAGVFAEIKPKGADLAAVAGCSPDDRRGVLLAGQRGVEDPRRLADITA